MQGLAGCSAKLGHGYRNNFWQLSNSCYSHLDGPGEPWGATWRPRGRPWRELEGPDVHGRLRRHSRVGKGAWFFNQVIGIDMPWTEMTIVPCLAMVTTVEHMESHTVSICTTFFDDRARHYTLQL